MPVMPIPGKEMYFNCEYNNYVISGCVNTDSASAHPTAHAPARTTTPTRTSSPHTFTPMPTATHIRNLTPTRTPSPTPTSSPTPIRTPTPTSISIPPADLSRMYGIRYYSPVPNFTSFTSFSERSWGSRPTSPHATAQTGPLVTFSFLLSEKVEKVSYKQQQEHLRKAFANCSVFKEGLLFGTREKGVLFPVVHLSYKKELWNEGDTDLAQGLALHQGIYQEVRNIVPETELPQVVPVPEDQATIGYILMGFKSLDRNFSQVMVDTWKDWTGARYIYMYLPDDLGLRRITFYHRQQPDDLDFFMYLVVVECHGITSKEKQLRLLDFAQRMRLERMSGYVSVYSAERKGDGPPPAPTPTPASKSNDFLDVYLTNTVIPRNTRV